MNDPRDFFHDLAPRELEELRRALLPGESIYWGTRPVPVFWQGGTSGILVFGAVWTLITLLVTYGILFGEAQGEFGEPLGELPLATRLLYLLFTVPFWLVGLALLAAPWWEYWQLRRTLYLVTSRRALILERGMFSCKRRAFALGEGLLLWRRVQKDGGGDLVFEAEDPLDRSGYVGFLHLPDAQLAERKLEEAAARAAVTPPAE